ncbi:MAG: SMC domain protein [Candidatus Yanofskybacteria bacterium GW2011_GWD2_39_48]|uniref:SMC domain protein n=1 Tax=Candidatus Yanofskybacteria bacterium GW2011_GWD2_39_48 TaxID=1619031 RepID=A0A0G0P730_9BACT|nr:MAG: SMC domain protein [Candidatus Yanofskybacteria bacterium GW2011_GWD2_39_48]
MSWFRGASDEVLLELASKSVVVYGPNGSGKSSFVDAVEHIINKGKIGHLAHEYSGRRQEKGVINTATPEGASTSLEFIFDNNKELTVGIQTNGNYSVSGQCPDAMALWDYRRTILRQSEVADFINGTKGDKYSDILPLLGLRPLELVAENFRQIARVINRGGEIVEAKTKLEAIQMRRREKYGNVEDVIIISELTSLCKKYCPESIELDINKQCEQLGGILDKQIRGLNSAHQVYLTLKEISNSGVFSSITSVRSAVSKLVNLSEPLISERLSILQEAKKYGVKLETGIELNCPACGQGISSEDFNKHISSEQQRLQETLTYFSEYKRTITKICDDILAVRNCFKRDSLKSWLSEISLNEGVLLGWLLNYRVEDLRSSCTEEDLVQLEKNLMPLINTVNNAAVNAPDNIQTLLDEQKTVSIASEIAEARRLKTKLDNISAVSELLCSVEVGARQQIRDRSAEIISNISTDIQSMWEILHPDKKIENVHLNLPSGIDKAIDVCLKFYGKDQDSPRITLSEGYRNSLGLCIFLAMVKRDSEDHPLLLDDVIISLDRGYRGMVAELLVREFPDKQVLIFTHDREWFADLRLQLDESEWQFKALMPWSDPTTGIMWSAKVTGFDVATQQLETTTPDVAANTARKIMDIDLPPRAEKLNLKLPYKHREHNDKRMAHEFLEHLAADGEKCFQIKNETGDYTVNEDALAALKEADGLIQSWANRGSHDFNVEKNEAKRLIDVCEKAMASLDCGKCGKFVGKYEDESAHIKQCQCGHIRWRYDRV